MLGILYKVLAKAIAIRLNPHLRKHIHTSQEMVMLQLDFAKAFDTMRWDFIQQVMSKMGFGEKISNVIFLLVEGAQSVINLNGKLTEPISMVRSIRQGCPLSPLLFAIASHPLFCYLEAQATNGHILGLQVQQRNILGLGFVDNTYMFLKATDLNIQRCMGKLSLFSLAVGLNLNIDKSTLIDLSATRFDSLIWQGKRLSTGHVFRHLGYPIGVNVSNKMLIDWVIERVRGKILYWKSDEWPLHVRLWIIQSILISYFLYYLPLLDWRECSGGAPQEILVYHVSSKEGVFKL